ncbi:hypothetical protein M9458_058003 [Cirrhinus mrigala]|uniref:NACHT domain-containing protein n=1 Tax=Cirrhinus mrigala TaxID=683832 RepID=A0ABD0MAC3_CIRMR
MKKKAERIFEVKEENEADLQAVYTELFITEGDMKEVNQEHEILKIDDAFKNKKTQNKPIKCNDIFKLLKEKNEKKIVLTKGVAGIGKTVSVHKFILDWAEGEANQDIHCVFLLEFRQINRIKDQQFNLHEFLLKFYAELKDLEKSKLYEKCKLAFIFDGLDESRLPLEFKKNEIVNDVEERSSVDVLFTNLVEGNLLPSALVWVTSRPAAANQIPHRYVGLFTEVRGFTDQQKEQYFRKRITDESLADRIISHIKTNRSLYIMCHNPVFCCITATVLQDNLKNSEENNSTTLTEMYIHFLLILMNMKSQKYDEQEERQRTEHLRSNREMILKLAKLAFEQLKRENVVFYEEDLKSCGIDVSKDTEFTGMIAEIFKMEHGLHETKIFSFVHLSVQEFLAAVHVFICYLNNNKQELQFFFEPEGNITLQGRHFFFESERNITLQVWHFFFEREGNITLQGQQFFSEREGNITLQGRHFSSEREGNITLQGRHFSSVRELNITSQELLFFFEREGNITSRGHLVFFEPKREENDTLQELLEMAVDKAMRSKRGHLDLFLRFLMGITLKSSQKLLQVLTYVLLMSEKVLDEFNPKRFTSSQENYKRLLPAVRCCRKAFLLSRLVSWD